MTNDERNRDEQIVPMAAHEVTMRWPLPAGVDQYEEQAPAGSTMASVKKTLARYFGILAVSEPDNRGRLIVLTCEELVGEDRGL